MKSYQAKKFLIADPPLIKGKKFKMMPNSSELINSSKLGVKKYSQFLSFKCALSELNSSIYKKDITIWIFNKNFNKFKFPPTEVWKAKMNICSVTPRVRPNSRKNMNAIRHGHRDTLPCQLIFPYRSLVLQMIEMKITSLTAFKWLISFP